MLKIILKKSQDFKKMLFFEDRKWAESEDRKKAEFFHNFLYFLFNNILNIKIHFYNSLYWQKLLKAEFLAPKKRQRSEKDQTHFLKMLLIIHCYKW